MSYRVMSTGQEVIGRLIVQARELLETVDSEDGWLMDEHEFKDWIIESRALAVSCARLTRVLEKVIPRVATVSEAEALVAIKVDRDPEASE